MKHGYRLHAIHGWFARRWQIAISDRKQNWHALRFIQVENSDPPERLQGHQVGFYAGPDIRSSKVTCRYCLLCLKSKSNIRIQGHVSIDLRKKLFRRCLRARRHTKQQQEECRHQPSSANMHHYLRISRDKKTQTTQLGETTRQLLLPMFLRRGNHFESATVLAPRRSSCQSIPVSKRRFPGGFVEERGLSQT